jgi:hypothetical protein
MLAQYPRHQLSNIDRIVETAMMLPLQLKPRQRTCSGHADLLTNTLCLGE